MRENEPILLEMLIKHELAIKLLYETFAELFSTHQNFWQKLASDEQKHADQLGTLRSETAFNTSLLQESRLKLPAIKSSIDYVERQTAKAREGNVSFLEALSIARDIENALLEKQFAKLGDAVSREVKKILMVLATETEKHRNAIAEALHTEKHS